MSKTIKPRKLLSLVMVIAIMLSISGMATIPAMAEGPATLDGDAIMTLPLGEKQYADGVDITGLPEGWTATPSSLTTTQVTNGLVTMTVDGTERQILTGTYTGDVVFTVTPLLTKDGTTITNVTRPNYDPQRYRAGLFFDENGLATASSIASAADQSKVDTATKTIDGLNINSGDNDTRDGSPQFSGIIFNGNDTDNSKTIPALDYVIKNSDINLFSNADGNPWSSSDFSGLGAAIMVNNGARVTLDNVNIHTTGVGKPALLTAAGSFLFKNSSFNVEGGTLNSTYRSGADFNRMMSPPWVLGIGGNARGANLLGNNSVQGYVDSDLKSAGWAVLSTDSGSGGVVTAINSNLTMTGPTGYGIYAIGGATEAFYGCNFDVATYATIFTGCNGVSFQPYTAGDKINIGDAARGFTGIQSENATGTVPSTIDSQFGFMAHQGSNPLSLTDTDINTHNATFLCKTSAGGPGGPPPGPPPSNESAAALADDAGFNVTMTGGNITKYADGYSDNVLVQVIDNDDPPIGLDMNAADDYGSFGMPAFNTYFVEKAGWPTATTKDPVGGFTGTFTDTALTGNMYNASGYQYSTRDEQTGDISTSDATPQNMNITLGQGATLTGAISTSRAVHTWMVWQDAPGVNAQNGFYRYATPADESAILDRNTDDPSSPAFLGGRTVNPMDVNGTTYLQATSYRESDYYNQGHVVNDVGAFSNATANVTLTGNAVWNVTDTCFLTGLTVGAGATLNLGDFILLVNGENKTAEVASGAHSYSGEIIITSAAVVITGQSYATEVAEIESQDPMSGATSTSLLPDAATKNISKITKDITLKSAVDGTALKVVNAWDNSATTEMVDADGTTITTPDDADGNLTLTTLTINGVQYDIADKLNYWIPADEAVITYTKNSYAVTNMAPGLSMLHPDEFQGPPPTLYEAFRAALLVGGGAIDNNASVSAAILDGAYDDTKATGITVNSQGNNFNGILVNNSDYTIDKANITLNGNGGDDFQGWGAGIMVTSDKDKSATLNVKNSYIDATGALRTGIWAGGQGTTKLNVDSSVIVGYSGSDTSDLYPPMMTKVPWVLGLTGNNRVANTLGNATSTFTNSIIVSNGWAALSTDSGNGSNAAAGIKDADNILAGIGNLEVAQPGKTYDATKSVGGVDYGFTIGKLGEESGYVSYADQGIHNTYSNSQFFAPDYLMILAAQASGATLTNVTGVTDRFGFMFHQNHFGELDLIGGDYTVADTMFLVRGSAPLDPGAGGGSPDKSSYPIINVDGAKLSINGTSAQSGTLLQLMPTDDTSAGGPFFGDYTVPAEGPDTAGVLDVTNPAVEATFNNVKGVAGNIYNSVQGVNQAIDATFSGGSDITGVISSSWSYHVDANGVQYATGKYLSEKTAGDNLALGRIVNVASPAVNNAVNLTLEDSKWTVTGTSYLSKLTMDATSSIVAPDGYTLSMTLDGKTANVGSCEGAIVLSITPISGGSGSSGGSIITTIPAADGAVSVSFTQSGSSVTLVMPDTKITEIIDSTKTGVATLDLTALSGVTDVNVPGAAIAAFADAGLGLEIKMPQGSVKLDAAALESLAEQAGGADVTLSVKQIKTSDLTQAQRDAVKSTDLIFSISLMAGDKVITNFDGTLSITVPYKGELPVAVWYLDDSGALTRMSSVYNADTGTVTFTTTHLSVYIVSQDTANPFKDVKESDWFYDDVMYVFSKGLMLGTSDTTFSPNAQLTRGMVVTILWRLAGSPSAGNAPAFSDVKDPSAWYYDAVRWAATDGIVTGYPDGTFGPNVNISRQDLATIILRYINDTGVNIPVTQQYVLFADEAKIADYAKNAIQVLNILDIIRGTGVNANGQTIVDPTASATRAQAAAIFHRVVVLMERYTG